MSQYRQNYKPQTVAERRAAAAWEFLKFLAVIVAAVGSFAVIVARLGDH